MFRIKRKTSYENIFSVEMGNLTCKVTKIYKTFFGIPYKLLHTYRETYYGEVKDLNNCKIEK